MKDICKILGRIYLVFGIIGGVAISALVGSGYDGRDWPTTIILFTSSLFTSIMVWALFETINDLEDGQEQLYKKLQEIENKIN